MMIFLKNVKIYNAAINQVEWQLWQTGRQVFSSVLWQTVRVNEVFRGNGSYRLIGRKESLTPKRVLKEIHFLGGEQKCPIYMDNLRQ